MSPLHYTFVKPTINGGFFLFFKFPICKVFTRFWSFYELNNGEIIDLNLEENLTNEKVTSIHYHFDYSKYKLKSGEFFEYKFGNAKPDTQEIIDEFFDWFESIPPTTDIKKLRTVSQDEEKCVKDFYLKHIEPSKGVKTDTKEV